MFTPEKVKMKVGISGTLVFKDAAGNVIGSTEILDPKRANVHGRPLCFLLGNSLASIMRAIRTSRTVDLTTGPREC